MQVEPKTKVLIARRDNMALQPEWVAYEHTGVDADRTVSSAGALSGYISQTRLVKREEEPDITPVERKIEQKVVRAISDVCLFSCSPCWKKSVLLGYRVGFMILGL